MEFDKIIIGGGLYGLYAALLCGRSGQKTVVLEYDKEPFMRATYINQARVHMGYHYPRSYSTAIKSAHYFERFHYDYKDCIYSVRSFARRQAFHAWKRLRTDILKRGCARALF